jgi:HK97 family phage major capsid protein
MKNRKRLNERNRRIAMIAMPLLVIVGIVLLPLIVLSLITAPKVTGGICMAGALMGGVILRDPDPNGGGGSGVVSALEKTSKALESLDNRLKSLNDKVGELEKVDAKKHGEEITALKTQANEVKLAIDEMKKTRLTKASTLRTFDQTRRGLVSDECAREIAGHFVAHCAASGKLEALSSSSATRDAMLNEARAVLGITGKTAITASDIPLPSVYGGEIRELISQFGVCRRKMFPYPIGMGTARPARMGTRPSFGSIAMSAAFDEKSPTVTFASLESHKIGGLVRLPREIDEQSIVPMGQYLARYGAIEFARAEDTWGFLADGTATYESVKGLVQIASDNSKTVTLAAGKTKPSDATLADFRSLRRKVNKAALSGGLSAYYLDTTWETALAGFKTQAEPLVYQRLPDGTAILDGYPIIWTDVLQAYDTAAAASKTLAVFGALSFWWLGEHGSPRIDTSEHVFFANDQLATRFIEEIDFDYCAADAVAALLTPAA